jgi:galactokinase
VRHVLRENARVRDAVEALRTRNTVNLGELIDESHRSLRDDYEVSTPELDRLVELAHAEGAVGARLVGGGFGGSILALARAGRARDLAEGVLRRYDGGRLVAVVP